MEMLGGFTGTAVEPGYFPWTYVDFFDKDDLLIELVKCYKQSRVATAVGEVTLDILPLMLCVFRVPCQLIFQRLMLVKSKESVAFLVKRLRRTRSRCEADFLND